MALWHILTITDPGLALVLTDYFCRFQPYQWIEAHKRFLDPYEETKVEKSY